MTRYSDGANKNDDKLLVPKQEIVEFDFPDERVHPNHAGVCLHFCNFIILISLFELGFFNR